MSWIPITIFAAFAQTCRNAAQRHLVAELGTLGATLVRFLFGLPFSIAWLLAVYLAAALPMPRLGADFLAWVVVGSLAQVTGTALLLRTMAERNFAVGVAYSKTEVLQVALFAMLLLGETLNLHSGAAVLCGVLGVFLLAPAGGERVLQSLASGFASRTALLGLGCGTGMALSSVAYGGAVRSLHSPSLLLNASVALVVAQLVPAVLLGAWLWRRERTVLCRAFALWRQSLLAGFMGAAASAGWMTAFALKPVTYVRTLGLIEMIFSYAVSRRLFREKLTSREIMAGALLAFGVVLITTAR